MLNSSIFISKADRRQCWTWVTAQAEGNVTASLDSMNRNPQISAGMDIFIGTSTCPLLHNNFKLIFCYLLYNPPSTGTGVWSRGVSQAVASPGNPLGKTGSSWPRQQLRQPRGTPRLHCTPCGCRGRDGAAEKFGFTASDSRECHM